MNNITKEIIQINDDIDKDNIAIVLYSNSEDDEVLYKFASELICQWVTKKDNIKLYVTDYENDKLKLDKTNTNKKVIYVLNDNFEDEYHRKNIFEKIYYNDRIDESEKLYVKVYSCFENVLSSEVKFSPYSHSVYDYNGAEDFEVEEELFSSIEEVFAKEIYRKCIILSLYNVVNERLYSFEGYEYSIIKNNFNDNSNIIEVINDSFNTKIKYEDISDLKIDTINKSLKEIYLKDLFELDKSSNERLEELIKDLESKLGKYKKTYIIMSEEDEESIINSFYVYMNTWCIVFEEALLVIAYGSNE